MMLPYSMQFLWVLNPVVPHHFKYPVLLLLLLFSMYFTIYFHSNLYFDTMSANLLCKNIYRMWVCGNVLVFGYVTTPPQYFKVRYSSPNRPELIPKESHQNKIKFLADSVAQHHQVIGKNIFGFLMIFCFC